MKRLLPALCLSAAFAVTVPAAAEDQRSARADSLFREGQALLDSGKVEAACSKFEASEAWENGLGTLLHLGDCYERAGRNASAWHTFLEAEAVAQSKKDSAREQIAAERVAALEPKLARVVFVVPPTSRVGGVTVQLNNNTIPAASWGTMIPVDAGLQHISVFAKGYQPWSTDVEVTRTEAREYRVTIPTLAIAAAPVAHSNRRANFRTAGIVTGSVGIAGLGAGALFGALSKNDETQSCPKGMPQCTLSKSNSSSNYSEASTVSLAVGGALLATGITLFVLAPAPDNQEKHALRVAAHPSTSGGRLQLEGVW